MTSEYNVEQYGSWDMSRTVIRRSRLRKVSPLGIGTSMVESLSSYVGRVAEEHDVLVGTLLREEIAPCLGARPSSYVGRFLHTINGTSMLSAQCVSALESLTGTENLHALTLITLTDAIAPTKLLDTSRKWCTACLNEWDKDGVVYEPLLWKLNYVTTCQEHGTPLQHECPHASCVQTRPKYSQYRPGYCHYCGGWLGDPMTYKDEVSHRVRPDDHLITASIGNLLESILLINRQAAKGLMQRSLRSIVKRSQYTGNKTFGRAVGIDRTQLNRWLTDIGVPELQSLVKICISMDVKLSSLFLCSDIENARTAKLMDSMPRNRKQHINYEEVSRKFKEILENQHTGHMSIRDVCEIVGCSRPTLKQYFSVECELLKERNKEYSKQQREIRQEEVAQNVRRVVLGLLEEEIYPSMRNVQASLNITGMSYKPDYVQAWRATLDSCGVTRRVN